MKTNMKDSEIKPGLEVEYSIGTKFTVSTGRVNIGFVDRARRVFGFASDPDRCEHFSFDKLYNLGEGRVILNKE